MVCVCPFCRTVSIKIPPSLSKPTTKSFGHLMRTSQPARAKPRRHANAATKASAVNSCCGLSQLQPTLNIRLSPNCVCHARPCRPRPAVCSNAATTCLWTGRPARTRCSNSSLVEVVCGSTVNSNGGTRQPSSTQANGFASRHTPSRWRKAACTYSGACCHKWFNCCGAQPSVCAKSAIWCGRPSASRETSCRVSIGISKIKTALLYPKHRIFGMHRLITQNYKRQSQTFFA